MSEPLRVVTPQILDVQASISGADEGHVGWSIGYAPEVDEDDSSRVILTHLNAVGLDGRVDVEVAATVLGDGAGDLSADAQAKQFEERLADSEELGILFDIARLAARSLLGLIDIELDLPMVPPSPSISRLVRTSGAE